MTRFARRPAASAEKHRRIHPHNTEAIERAALNSQISKHKYVIFRAGEEGNKTSVVGDTTASEFLKCAKDNCNKEVVFQQPNKRRAKDQQDNKRLQWEIKNSNIFPGLLNINNRVKELIDKMNANLRFNEPSLLHSLAGCMQQELHYDHNPTIKEGKASFGVIVFLEDGGKLVVLEKHNSKEKELYFNKGDIIIFRSDLVHAGAAYDRANSRLHYYFDAPNYERKNERFVFYQYIENVRKMVCVARQEQLKLNRSAHATQRKARICKKIANFSKASIITIAPN